MVGHAHIVMGARACDTAVMESSIVWSPEGLEISKVSVAVIEGDATLFS